MSRCPPPADEEGLPTLAFKLTAITTFTRSVNREELAPDLQLATPSVATLDLTALTFVAPATMHLCSR